ncbi:MAG TPA: hypothetical protein VJ385_07645 [Fibrobacteria bacterium]|nr:hypothetical protein [Fibrobacteria bacterium]
MHPDYEMKEVPLAAKYKTMGMGFLSDGRMVLATTDFIGGGEVPATGNVNHKILIITNPGAADAANVQVKEVANTWRQIAGISIVEDKIYVSDRDGFYKILDIEGSSLNLAGNRQKLISWPDENKWNSGYTWHQWVFTPMFWQGSFYAPYSGSIRKGGPSDVPATTAYSGAFLKWDLNGTTLTKFAGGLRSPNGANMAPNGDMFVADNQGSWLPSSTFMLMKPGKFYGHRQSPKRDAGGNVIQDNAPNWAESLPYERPTAWLDNGAVRTSPSQPVYITKGRYTGDWLLGDVNNAGLVRIALDKVDDTYNGAVFWFSKGMGNAAINRLAWSKDGSLYVGTLMNTGNWPSGNAMPLYKVTPKATASTFDMKAIRHLADGVEILFTDPVDAGSIAGGNFSVSQWNYTRQEKYGAGKGPAEARTVSATELSSDGKRVHLKIAGLKDDYVTYFKLANVKAAAAGAAVWNNEAWFTLNKFSTRVWDPSPVGVAAPMAAKLEGLVRQRVTGAGLEVSVSGEGDHAFSLIALNGARMRTATTKGPASVILPTAGLAKGLYLLEVRQGSETLVRPVSLSL